MTDENASGQIERVQLHLVLPYNIELRRHEDVQRLLQRGYHVEELQRVTDREVLVTLARAALNDRAC